MSDQTYDKGRTHLDSRFMRESLVDRKVLSSAEVIDEIAILPYLDVISLGGSSIIDRGKSAVFPVIDELLTLIGKFKFAVSDNPAVMAPLREGIALVGIAPSEVAERVVEAVVDDRFWIFTHPTTKPHALVRGDDIAADRNPSEAYPDRSTV